MPHVLVKLYSGRSEQQKTKLAAAVAKAVVTTLKCGDDAVSVAIEDVNPQAWTAEVYKTDILNNPNIYIRSRDTIRLNDRGGQNVSREDHT